MNTFYFIGGILFLVLLFYFLTKKSKPQKKKSQPEMSIENKWLNPTDSFGKMERGVVHDVRARRSNTEPVKK